MHEDTCSMLQSGQFVVDLISSKKDLGWVECMHCRKWTHCICVGIPIVKVVDEKLFSGCKHLSDKLE